MRSFVSYIAIGLSAMLLTACGPTLRVSSDYDRSVDFTSYKTYSIAENDSVPQTLVIKRLKAALMTEMDSLGYTYQKKGGDLLLAVSGDRQKKESTSVTQSGMPTYRGRYGYYGGYQTYSVDTYEYYEGSFTVMLVDFAQNQVIWQGTATDTYNNPDTSEERINEVVTKIFSTHPLNKPAQ